jgi:glycosyltransferase involved in cell wall biosynthesis
MRAGTNKNFIFVVTHLFPYAPSHGTELRILKLIKALHTAGYQVVLILCEPPREKEYVAELLKFVAAVHCVGPSWRTRLGRRFPRTRRLIWENVKPLIPRLQMPDTSVVAKLYEQIPSTVGDERKKRAVVPAELAVLVSDLARRYQPIAVIAEYIFLTDCFALLKPDVLRVTDTIDVFSLRGKQVVNYGIDDDPWICTPEEERAYLLRADVIIAIHEREARVLRELVPERQVLTVGIDFEIDKRAKSNLTAPDSITVVASAAPLNVHGLKKFFTECWPDIKSAHPAATINVVGTVGSCCRIEDASVNYIPRAEDLSEVYRRSRVVINPTVAGTGLKVKSVEALAHGKPLVAWPLGVDGLDYGDEPPYVKCESAKEFAAAVIRLLEDDDAADALSKRALEYAGTNFEQAKVYAPLNACLKAHASINRPSQSGQVSVALAD